MSDSQGDLAAAAAAPPSPFTMRKFDDDRYAPRHGELINVQLPLYGPGSVRGSGSSISSSGKTRNTPHSAIVITAELKSNGMLLTVSLCSSRYWAARAPPFKIELRLNPSQSKAATDTGSSRNATTPFCEVAKFQRNNVSTKKNAATNLQPKQLAECTQEPSKGGWSWLRCEVPK
jgi:hypothetical protein